MRRVLANTASKCTMIYNILFLAWIYTSLEPSGCSIPALCFDAGGYGCSATADTGGIEWAIGNP